VEASTGVSTGKPSVAPGNLPVVFDQHDAGESRSSLVWVDAGLFTECHRRRVVADGLRPPWLYRHKPLVRPPDGVHLRSAGQPHLSLPGRFAGGAAGVSRDSFPHIGLNPAARCAIITVLPC